MKGGSDKYCSGEDDDDYDEKVEAAKQVFMSGIEVHSLEQMVRKEVPVDIMALFELKWAEETIDRNAELRREILSFAEITFDSRRCFKMFVNFPKHNLVKLRRLLKPFSNCRSQTAEKGPIVEAARLEP